MSYDNSNSGIISKNDRKQTDKHPDYTGTINVNGVPHYLSGWIKQRNDGTGSFLSLQIKPKEERQAPAKQAKTPAFDDDNDPPF